MPKAPTLRPVDLNVPSNTVPFRTINSQLDMQNIDFILKMLEQSRNDEKHYRKMSNHFFRSANTT